MKLTITNGRFTYASIFKLIAVSTGLALAPFFIFSAVVFTFNGASMLIINDVTMTGVTAAVTLLVFVLPASALANGLVSGAVIWFGLWLYSLKRPIQIEYMPEE